MFEKGSPPRIDSILKDEGDTASGRSLVFNAFCQSFDLHARPKAFIPVPWRGFEPPRGCPHMVLSHARLPVPPPGQLNLTSGFRCSNQLTRQHREIECQPHRNSLVLGLKMGCRFFRLFRQSQLTSLLYTLSEDSGSQPGVATHKSVR